TGDYRLTAGEYAEFHRLRIDALAGAGAGVVAIRTQPRLDEIRTVISLAEETGVPAWLSVTLRTGTTLPDGSGLADLAETANTSAAVQAIGVNCVLPSLVTPALEVLSAHTDLPLIAYPNSGEFYDADAMTWRDNGAEAGVGSWPAPEWARLGARII